MTFSFYTLMALFIVLVIREALEVYPLSLQFESDSIPGIFLAYQLTVWDMIETQLLHVQTMIGFTGLHLSAIIGVLMAAVWYMRRQHGISVTVLNSRQQQMLADFDNYLQREVKLNCE